MAGEHRHAEPGGRGQQFGDPRAAILEPVPTARHQARGVE
jgi:hypothetical protein